MYKSNIRIFLRKEKVYHLNKKPRFWDLNTFLIYYSGYFKQTYFKDE